MTIHASVQYDDSGYQSVLLKTKAKSRMWNTHVISDWYRLIQYARTINDILMYSSSLTHFLWDVPGYRTVERPDGEFIVADPKDGAVSPRDADWTNGIVNGWNATEVGSDGWAKGWVKGTRHAWRCADHRLGMYWQTADLLDGFFRNHAAFPSQIEAFARA